MSLAQIRDEFHVPARLGARVTADSLGVDGAITGSHEDYIAVHLDGLPSHIYIHPHDLTFH